MTHANFIIGFPDEKLSDLFNTYKLLIKMAWIGLHGVSVMMFSPYPGSALYVELKNQNGGILGNKDIKSLTVNCSIEY